MQQNKNIENRMLKYGKIRKVYAINKKKSKDLRVYISIKSDYQDFKNGVSLWHNSNYQN